MLSQPIATLCKKDSSPCSDPNAIREKTPDPFFARLNAMLKHRTLWRPELAQHA
jgi:hypothetical protein